MVSVMLRAAVALVLPSVRAVVVLAMVLVVVGVAVKLLERYADMADGYKTALRAVVALATTAYVLHVIGILG